MGACENLMDSMNDTQEVILGLITDMTWSGDEIVDAATEEPGEDTP